MPDPGIEAIRALLAACPRSTQLAERRRRLDALGTQYALPADVQIEPVSANGVPAEWNSTPGAEASSVLLFLHGGGYVAGSLRSHRSMVAEAGRAAGLRCLALDYRLAPEHPFPAAVEDAVSGYRYLLDQGFTPPRIAIGGDSAGGGLAAATLVAIREQGLPMPACGWLVSPWVDLESTGDSMASKAGVDPMVQKPYLLEIAALYLGGAGPRTPLASPLHAALHGLPPLLVQVGASETLLDDAVMFARRAGAEDVAVTLEIWPEMIHVWHLFHSQVEGGRKALAAAGGFLRRHTQPECAVPAAAAAYQQG
jgi:monoterpene epsilon-lactone hydrolase